MKLFVRCFDVNGDVQFTAYGERDSLLKVAKMVQDSKFTISSMFIPDETKKDETKTEEHVDPILI